MNEIMPGNIQYVLWSEDDEYSSDSLLNRDEFISLVNKLSLNNDILVYANVIMSDGKHNSILENRPNTLLSHISDYRWYATWFIDDNNDLWCRDDTYSQGLNHYLVREYSTKDESIKQTIKMSLLLDLPSFNEDIIKDNTIEIGTRIIELLDLERTKNNKQATLNQINAYDLTYMTMLINQELDNVLFSNTFDLDILSDKLTDCLNAWYQWDNNNQNKETTINSMKKFINQYDKMIIGYLNEASHENLIKEEKHEYQKA